MSPLVAQRLIAVPFIVLGAWCLAFPGMVERLTIRPVYQHGTITTALFIGCFGAQAVLSGVFAAFSQFTKGTFLAYGIALLPFFWFNYWFVYVVPVFNDWMIVDLLSNLIMLALCVVGYLKSPDTDSGQ